MTEKYKLVEKYKKNKHKFKELSDADIEALESLEIFELSEDKISTVLELSEKEIALDSHRYNFHDDKYFHPILKIVDKKSARKMFKVALYDRYFDDNSLSKLIYLKDKHAKVRGKSDNIFDRLDTYRVDFELRKDGKYTLRHHGTKEGGDLRQSFFKSENIEYGLFLQNGPTSIEISFVSHFTKLPIEAIKVSHPVTGEIRINIPAQYHHAKYDMNGSTYKTKEPSQLLGMKNYKDFTQEEHLEMLGCIILSSNEHDTVHIFDSGGINVWKKWAEQFGYTLPFHWICEENYNISLTHLESITNGKFLRSLAPCYEKFIEMNS